MFRARHQELGRQAALKVLRIEGRDATALKRFEREAQLLCRLEHPNIVQALDAGSDQGVPWLALELVPGRTLDELQFGVRELVSIMARIARAVGAAHRAGVVHRDLKPGNVLVAQGSGEPKVVDFGLAFDAAPDVTRLSRTGEAAGTPAFMAPEVVRGEARPDDPRRDVYALGLMLYERLAGAHPFVREGDGALAAFQRVLAGLPTLRGEPGVDADLAAICDRACALRLDERLKDGDALAAELEAWLARGAPSAPAATTGARSRWAVALVALTAAAALGALAFARPHADSPAASMPPVSPSSPAAPVSEPPAADDPHAQLDALFARASDPGAEFEARRGMVALLRGSKPLGAEDRAKVAVFFRTLGFDRAACCVIEEPRGAKAPVALRVLAMRFHLVSTEPVSDPVRAERLARSALADSLPGAPDRWLAELGLCNALIGQDRDAEATRVLEAALPEIPEDRQNDARMSLGALKTGFVTTDGMVRRMIESRPTTEYLREVVYQEEKAIDTEPGPHPLALVKDGDRFERESQPELAALARVRALRFLRVMGRLEVARGALERSVAVAARLPIDTRALLFRAFARSLVVDEPSDPARAEKLALEAAGPVEGFDARTPCEIADAWALVARARVARGDKAGALDAVARGRRCEPVDGRELDDMEKKAR